MAGRIEPTAEQLQAAWQHRRRADWPDSLDATMAVPMLATIVHCEAVRRCLAERTAERNAKRTAAAWAALRPYTAPVRRPPAPPPVQARLPLDRKRLAAGERDDD